MARMNSYKVTLTRTLVFQTTITVLAENDLDANDCAEEKVSDTDFTDGAVSDDIEVIDIEAL